MRRLWNPHNNNGYYLITEEAYQELKALVTSSIAGDCNTYSEADWLCNRDAGHEGLHVAAGTDGEVYAVWD